MATNSATGRSRYSSAAITLHWLIAGLVILNVILGLFFMEDNRAVSEVHKSTGLLILALTLVRLAIRLQKGFIPLPGHMAAWEVVLARANHVAFYVLLLTIPFAGWAFGISAERPTEFYGLFQIPSLGFGEGARGFFHDYHIYAAFTAIALVLLHVAGALKHQFLDEDDVLARMLPLVRRRG